MRQKRKSTRKANRTAVRSQKDYRRNGDKEGHGCRDEDEDMGVKMKMRTWI